MKILAIHSEEDSLLQAMSADWLTIVTSSAIAPYELETLLGSSASRKWNSAFTTVVASEDVAVICGLAHGTPGAFTGFQGEILYSAGPSGPLPAKEASGRIVHLLSCSTAQQLARAFLAAGCVAYIGYSDLVPIKQSDPVWLMTFLRCDATIELSLSKRRCASTAVQDAKAQFQINGLGDIAALLVCSPADSTAVLPQSNSVASSGPPTNQIAARPLPPPNMLPIAPS